MRKGNIEMKMRIKIGREGKREMGEREAKALVANLYKPKMILRENIFPSEIPTPIVLPFKWTRQAMSTVATTTRMSLVIRTQRTNQQYEHNLHVACNTLPNVTFIRSFACDAYAYLPCTYYILFKLDENIWYRTDWATDIECVAYEYEACVCVCAKRKLCAVVLDSTHIALRYIRLHFYQSSSLCVVYRNSLIHHTPNETDGESTWLNRLNLFLFTCTSSHLRAIAGTIAVVVVIAVAADTVVVVDVVAAAAASTTTGVGCWLMCSVCVQHILRVQHWTFLWQRHCWLAHSVCVETSNRLDGIQRREFHSAIRIAQEWTFYFRSLVLTIKRNNGQYPPHSYVNVIFQIYFSLLFGSISIFSVVNNYNLVMDERARVWVYANEWRQIMSED